MIYDQSLCQARSLLTDYTRYRRSASCKEATMHYLCGAMKAFDRVSRDVIWCINGRVVADSTGLVHVRGCEKQDTSLEMGTARSL